MENHPNFILLDRFYNSFKRKDITAVQHCYAENATFNDEVFKDLDTFHVRMMWEMLIKRGKDLEIEYQILEADNEHGKAKWIARYTFSSTKRKVENHIHSSFRFSNGKIIEQNDTFDLKKWAKQALGMTGFLFGGAAFFQAKIRKNAQQALENYIQKNSH
jgi:ketosteroid isomerase-like protein